MVLPTFGDYDYYHEARSKPEIILFWTRDIVTVYRKETQVLINYGDIDINKMDCVDLVVDGDYWQGFSCFSMKILYIMNNGKSHENIQHVGYILYKEDNSIIL